MKKEENNDKTRQNTHPKGVFPAFKKDGTPYFRASLTYKRKHISLGSHATAQTARLAYLEGTRLLCDPSIGLIHYTEESPLSFEKWVCLLNFRDNDIYFGTPIYIHRKFFYYHLTPSKSLKFDLDDLFYYASHKIMCRGNHYFVADYGMQINLVSRYGIKNYAVEGRDFRFLNGDPTDFRRENLEIFNTYHGIRLTRKNGQYVYTVRIHIRGDYLVGQYASREEAAIAYNKAIDILRRNGVRKNFTPNYIEGMSPARYADIYTRVDISPKIRQYRPATSPNNQ
ncbi:MAG: hypothetical protein NC079_11480 [Clostridium sp.]|nr:hypothetical protein [Acetatifactor muris]MCM1528049.1 hypothetical protein [Bacteroides sp.]MCM1564211.1 hypothetical protein [Clostridium sp.]